MAYDCGPCRRSFPSAAALQQHITDAPKHRNNGSASTQPETATVVQPASTADANVNDSTAKAAKVKAHPCLLCPRRFASQQALADHVADSPNHAAARSPQPNPAGQPDNGQPLVASSAVPPVARPRNTTATAKPNKTTIKAKKTKPSTPGETGPRTDAAAALTPAAAAATTSKKKNARRPRRPDTPLDKFFRAFPSFTAYDPRKPPPESFAQLQRHMGWQPRSAASDKARKRYMRALADEVRLWFGTKDDPVAWATICRAVGIANPPHSRVACTKILRRTHVNIVDLVEWGRQNQNGPPVVVFATVDALRMYTRATSRYFNLDEMHNDEGETNIVLRHLLRKINSPG